jgi:PAS domain S-box-containing protein
LAGQSDYCTVPLITKARRLISVETRVKPGYWNGKPVIFGVSKDVSQIKLSEEKFSKAFQANSAMMAISNFGDGTFLEVNNSVLDTLGYTREDLIGKTRKEFNLYVDAETRNRITERLNKKIPVEKLEILIRTKDGTIKTGLLSADQIFIGEKRCLLTVIMDITERKIAEDDLKKARIEADNANHAKSEFLSRMSHELRTPMNSILGFAQLLEMAELNPRQMKGVNHILTSGKHLLKLIDEVLDISRIEAGKLILSPEKVQVGRIINEMLDSIQQLIASRHIKIELNISSSDEQTIYADRQRLKQALLNLLTNAVKYNKEGGTITISTSVMPQSDRGDVCLRISIVDTGNGISEEGMAKIFTPFERIGAEKTQTEGTGLGLAVVKKFIEAMDGNIGVESKPGDGCTFWIELPLAGTPKSRKELIEENLKLTADLGVANTEIGFQNKEKGKRADELRDAKSEIDFLTGQNRDQAIELDYANKELSFLKIPASIPPTALFGISGTILYIEDNESNIELIQQTLDNQRPDIKLLSNFTGKETVRIAIDCAADLILLDLDLPDLHGSEVFELLKADEITKHIPVVIISADAMPHQLEKFKLAGAKDYITKPVDIIAFLIVVDEWIGKRVN